MTGHNSEDPFAPREGTIVRPRPGAGRRLGTEARTYTGPSQSASPAAVPLSHAALVGQSGSLTDFLVGARNPIVQAAAALLALGARLAVAVQQVDVATLRQQAVLEVRAFEDRTRKAGVASEDVVVARYLLCTFVDSAVLNTPWGAVGDWAGQSLLVLFHKEVSGGEKFFDILERLRANPARYVDLLELVFVCLALGYEGKYRHDPLGSGKLGELQHELYRVLCDQRQSPDDGLSPHWKGVEDRRNPIIRYVPWWIIAAAGLAVLTGTFIILHGKLAVQAAPIKAALAGPSVSVNYPAPASVHANRLKQLLASEESAGRLSVEDFGGQTVVTLTAPELFRSGSARLSPELAPTLHTVAVALNQVPGRVVIVGHTDDQPVRSLRFADNFDLSRERALAVAALLKVALTTPGRLEWQGAGSTQPRYKPVDEPENRARNRRVEIIQIDQPERAR
ncbi:MAG TPA: type IVB secretion system protein IcmH/DotU [Steroidobacteraceae bacterium]